MPTLNERRDLECPECGGTLFFHVEAIQQLQNGSLVHPPKGRACLSCMSVINLQAVVEREQLQRLEKEVAQKSQRLDALRSRHTPTSKPVSSVKSRRKTSAS